MRFACGGNRPWLADHHRVVAELGRGAQGRDYRAVDEHLGREVALKVVASKVVLGRDVADTLRLVGERERWERRLLTRSWPARRRPPLGGTRSP